VAGQNADSRAKSYAVDSLAPRDRWIAQAAIIAAVAIYGVTTGLLTPLISLRLESSGASGSMIGLAATA
jgi:hypothetical protein